MGSHAFAEAYLRNPEDERNAHGANVDADMVVLLEYDQNDRVSWILSRNENRTFALDVRIRYVH